MTTRTLTAIALAVATLATSASASSRADLERQVAKVADNYAVQINTSTLDKHDLWSIVAVAYSGDSAGEIRSFIKAVSK